ncbi:DNA-processing protein DprA [Teichococcus cervicalis]|uniref:DNA protecting protein DprA n=1 Tax=Pseudoroseomonas cervicalis ATCC 49957 TaxID=525371 RepID=D5RQA3_9PROT|nr:DNA-processing protein DprA [Pseudoroseomonas cervicalis]EFH10561.1 DNA protecting protein DprA [Pseudoroseomonas cervicalis ATCC 49957]
MKPRAALSLLRLARTEGIGPLTFRRLLERHGTAEAALDALPSLPQRGFSLVPPPADAIHREMEEVAGMGGAFLFLGDDDYPPLLAELPSAPPALACIGDTELLGQPQVALVGARNASALGLRMAEELAEGLAESGLVVTSGLARGVDGAAHRGALRTGATIAVIPGGLDRAYPPEHAELQSLIAERGLVVAEAPLGTAPIARHFPRRNRIIAGLSLGVVVVEAGLRSGTLMTARLALEAGREVYAVPGSPLDPRCAGSNDLLRHGAQLTERARDVLDTLPSAPRRTAGAARRPAPVEAALPLASPLDEAGQLLDLIGSSPVVVDELLRRCHLSAAAVQALLLDLELEGRIQALPGNRVVRSGLR